MRQVEQSNAIAVESKSRRWVGASMAGLLAATLATAACSSEATPRGESGMGTAPPESSIAPRSAVKSLGARVCEGFFTQEAEGGLYMIGRPIVDKSHKPLDISVSAEGVEVGPRPAAEGAVKWYDLDGKETSRVACPIRIVFARKMEQPSGQTTWFASTAHPDVGLRPETLDASGLKSDTIGLTTFDLGVVRQSDVPLVFEQARHHS